MKQLLVAEDQRRIEVPDVGMMAAVDLGSNTFKLIVAEFSHGQLRIVDRLREVVRLASGLDEQSNLDQESQQRALECLARFGERLRDFPSERVRAVGTNTLRKARDSERFLMQASDLLGHEIDIISGIEEARLIFVGVSQSLSVIAGNHLIFDIGGGSTELAAGKAYQPGRLESLNVGCVGMTQRFFPGGEITAQRFNKARTAVRLELRPVAHYYRERAWDRVAGASGTIRCAVEICRELGLIETNLTSTALESLITLMVEQGKISSLDLPGLSEQRVPAIVGGLAILIEIMRGLNIQELVVAQGALREGIMYDLVGRLGDEDSRVRTVRAMESRYHVDQEQAARVELTATSLLDQVSENWKLAQPTFRKLLGWSARLHEIGLDIAHSHYHQHSAYLLRHADMPGFNQNEQRVLACLVGAHRRKFAGEKLADNLPKSWSKSVQRLAILLRLATLFNRSRSYEFPEVLRITAKKHEITLSLSEEWLQNNPLSLADLEGEQNYLKAVGFSLRFRAVNTP